MLDFTTTPPGRLGFRGDEASLTPHLLHANTTPQVDAFGLDFTTYPWPSRRMDPTI